MTAESRDKALDLVRVRRLRVGEDRAWRECRCGDWPPDGPDFTNDPAFRGEAHLVAERASRIVGRMESVLNEPYSAVLTPPIVRDGENVKKIARLLISESLRTAVSIGAGQIELILESHLPYLEMAADVVQQLRFERTFEKALYIRAVASFSQRNSAQLQYYRSVAETGSSAAISVIGEILSAPLNRSEIGAEAGSMFEELVEHCRRGSVFHPEDWHVAYHDDRPIGIVMPALTDLATHRATILFVGVTPDFRGRGLGLGLTLKGLETIARRSPTGFIDSTDVKNVPMRKILERLGYQLNAIQHYFRWRDADRARSRLVQCGTLKSERAKTTAG
jgi:ribosomal protein S18 acetylase RimI-like enzyme